MVASRSLIARLETDRADPENRPFTHPDPVVWTEANRGKILVALYTISAWQPGATPRFDMSLPRPGSKPSWRLVGSAVEHAASVADGHTGHFQTLCSCPCEEEDDEEATSLFRRVDRALST